MNFATGALVGVYSHFRVLGTKGGKHGQEAQPSPPEKFFRPQMALFYSAFLYA